MRQRSTAVWAQDVSALRTAAAVAERITKDRVRKYALRAYMEEVDRRGLYAEHHSVNVADHVVAIHRALGTPEQEVDRRYEAALLHDIGKLGVPPAILRKPSGLTDEEYEIVKAHAELGAEVVAAIAHLEDLAPEILHHHERVDGEGYPHGLSGDHIPLAARVLAVADAYDAMRTDRVYKAAMSHEQAAEELHRQAGSQFDAEVVEAFLALLEREDRVGGSLSERLSRAFR